MLTAEDISKLKQTNVSTNGDLTKLRTKELLKAATKEQKSEIETLAGLKRVSINRVYSTGNVSAKIAIAIAQILGLSPFYLTGDSEEQGEYTDETLKSFLSAKGINDVVINVAKPSRKKRGKAAKQAEDVAPPAPAVPSVPTVPQEPQEQPEQHEPKEVPACSAMTEDETLQLIRSLFIQGKYSENARLCLEQIKALLVM